MRYLAEVQKIGTLGIKTQLKLLAYQESEQIWSPVSDEETILSETANKYKAGAFVLVELNKSKQVQQIEEAARPLVGILQSYAHLPKLQRLEEDIKLWQQSYSEQKKMLTRRSLALQNREQQLKQQKEDFNQKLDRQREQIDSVWDDLDRLRQQLNLDRQKLTETLQQL
jgi:chromosome segregation ATPase